MTKKLAEFGVVPRKTGLEILPKIPDKFKPDLLRGLFDGDGCVTYVNRQYKRLRFDITCASKSFLESIKQDLGFNYGYIQHHCGIYRWAVYKQDSVRQLANYMYYSGYPFGLERKKERFYA